MYTPRDECWQFRPQFNDWVQLSTMPEDGGYAGYAYSDAWGLVIAGVGNSYTTVLHTKDGINFTYLMPLPVLGYYNCLVILDDNTLMAIGLGDLDDEVYVYHGGEQDYWEKFPNLAVGRYGMTCGVAAQGGDLVVVAAGGGISEDPPRSDVVEIFSFQEMQWHTGKGSKLWTKLHFLLNRTIRQFQQIRCQRYSTGQQQLHLKILFF